MFKILIALLISTSAFAGSQKEIGFGSYSYHLRGDPESFGKLSNKVSSDGRLIANGMLTYKNTKTGKFGYASSAAFIGQNSVGTLMTGYMGAVGALVTKNLQIGFIMGAYVQDNTEFMRREIKNSMALFPNSAISVVPLAGVEINYKVPLNKKLFLKVNNIITPAVTNHTLSIGVEF